MNNSLINRRSVLICSLILFVIACSLPALEFRRNENGEEIWGGGQTLALGWLGIFVGQIAWFANPVALLAAGLLIFRRWKSSAVCAILALLISLDTFSLYGKSIAADEGDVNHLFLQRVREGAYVWQASIGVILAGAFLIRSPQAKAADMPARSASE